MVVDESRATQGEVSSSQGRVESSEGAGCGCLRESRQVESQGRGFAAGDVMSGRKDPTFHEREHGATNRRPAA